MKITKTYSVDGKTFKNESDAIDYVIQQDVLKFCYSKFYTCRSGDSEESKNYGPADIAVILFDNRQELLRALDV